MESQNRDTALFGAGAGGRRAGAAVGWQATGQRAGYCTPAAAVRAPALVGRRARRGRGKCIGDKLSFLKFCQIAPA